MSLSIEFHRVTERFNAYGGKVFVNRTNWEGSELPLHLRTIRAVDSPLSGVQA